MTAEREPLLEGTLISHLLELRDRLLRAFIAVIIVFAPCMYYSNRLFEILSKPLREQLPAGGRILAESEDGLRIAPCDLSAADHVRRSICSTNSPTRRRSSSGVIPSRRISAARLVASCAASACSSRRARAIS